MRLGADVKVVSPPEVRKHLAEALRDALKHYGR